MNGLPNDPINVVKEDPIRRGLLFAGSERFVYVSFDDGANWRSLRLNMPATSIRDLVIKDDDLVIGTHGRSFWILDDITPLRQINNQLANNAVILFKPQTAIRVRWSMYPDTPIPQEEPAGQNPPDGAIINYYLQKTATDLRLEILDAKGTLVRKYTNKDSIYTIPAVNIPLYWVRMQEQLLADAGAHRFLWDMHYEPLNIPPSYPISAIYRNTAPNETSPWVLPGKYTAKLTVDGQSFSQPFDVKMDPRVMTSADDLQRIHDMAYICYESRKRCMKALSEIGFLRLQISGLMPKASAELGQKLKVFIEQMDILENTKPDQDVRGFKRLNTDLATIFNIVNESDLPLTSQTHETSMKASGDLEVMLMAWDMFKKSSLVEINQLLQKEKRSILEIK